jgi:hypothetical protein
MSKDLSNTYWNHAGLHQGLVAQLQNHVPASGAVENALELFRKASNCYYDLYNNGLCNRAMEFASVFRGVSSHDVRAIEARMDEIILAPAKEQGLEVHVDTTKIEILGSQCIDGGKCHHECKERCFRRECCGPLTGYEGPWAYPAEDLYKANGYDDREHYLHCLAEDNGVPFHEVQAVADLLGPSEDFDGLVTSIEDRAAELGE